jgi:hypothetical protein
LKYETIFGDSHHGKTWSQSEEGQPRQTSGLQPPA